MTLAPVAADFGLAAQHQRIAEANAKMVNPGYTRLTDKAAKDAYVGGTNACQRAGAQYENDLYPPATLTLDDALTTAVSAVEARPDVAAKITAYGAA